MPTVVHTADVHLGAPLGWLGKSATEQRAELGETFRRIIDLALEKNVDCLLIAGDLFDSNTPPASSVRFALDQMARLRDADACTAVILPGSHDFLCERSVYATYREEFERSGCIRVLGADGMTAVALRDSGLTVHGNPPRAARSSIRQLAEVRADGDVPFNIVMAHGSLATGPTDPDDHPIDATELALEDVSYFALGHWHSWLEVQQSPAPAVYCGAPEVIASDQTGCGHVARVELSESGTRVMKERVGRRAVADLGLDLTDLADHQDAVDRIRREVPPNRDTILRVTMSGLLSVSSAFDESCALDSLEGEYFHVCPPVRRYHVRLDDEALRQLPEQFVVGRYVRIMEARLGAAASEREREELEAALHLGVALLNGKDIL